MLVMKFGGASVAKLDCFLKIARIVMQRSLQHKKIVVVVSAMANTTDQLLEMAKAVSTEPPKRELDMLVSVGERVSVALLAMALVELGKEAVSFTGSQSGIVTCEGHSDARIVDVRPRRLQEVLDRGGIAVVAGFQGVSRKGEITTLGRGGSDTSAVALGVALGAERVEFYKDVAGIFDRDPKKGEGAKLLERLSYRGALALARGGAKVLHERCIALAEKNGVELAVHSFENPAVAGTVVGETARGQIYYEEPSCLHN
jgi:aspartate kinase